MKIDEILTILRAEFPNAQSELDYANPFELLIAVTLSAQTTDVAVNKVTPSLFRVYPTPYELAQAKPEEVEPFIKTIGLYRNKAKYIIACAQKLVDHFDGVVPSNRKDLMSLPGVGRKTANVVLGEAFGIPAIAVDTHVERVAKRLKLAKPDDRVEDVERKLMRKIPKDSWHEGHHLLLLFGRYYSTARNVRDAFEILEELKEKHNL